jgi:hypothetical protein
VGAYLQGMCGTAKRNAHPLNYAKSWRKREETSNTIMAATWKWPQHFYSNYVIVLLFSVNLVKEETGKKA